MILKDKTLAQEIINKARLLRQSSSNYTRQSIFINPNLTRAEATAAYLIRCQKRQSKLLETRPSQISANSTNTADIGHAANTSPSSQTIQQADPTHSSE